MSLIARAWRAVTRLFWPRGILGCDVSFNNKLVDWAGAKLDGVIFAAIRWGQRDGHDEPDGSSWTDPRVHENWTGAKAEGIDRFGYWVWDEREGDDADAHFAGVVRVYPTYNGELPFCVDLELEPVDWDELLKFLILLTQWTGRIVMIYCGAWFYNRVKPIPQWLEDYIHWLTGYNNDGPDTWGPIGELDIEIECWQQANNWQVSWCGSGAVDRDFWIGDYQKYKNGGSEMAKVVNSNDLKDWIDENEYEEEVQPPPQPDKFELVWPTPSPKVITQWYGINPQWYQPFGLPGHEGLDMRALNDTPIYAAAAGEVIRVETAAGSGPYGIHVRIQHDTPEGIFKTVYAHFRRAQVSVGDKVAAGEQIGLADNTGNSSGAHLHITLKRIGDGSPWMGVGDIVNPTPYLKELFPECTLPGHDRFGWVLDVGGNFRTSPNIGDNLIRYLAAGKVVTAHKVNKEDGGDWWEVTYDGTKGWFWNPGYKLRAL